MLHLVSHGSVLGPILFLPYINDINENIKSSIRLFADDSIIYRQINSNIDHQILQTDLIKLEKWPDKWQMQFNISKCVHLPITNKTKPSSHQYSLFGHPLSKVASHAYLRVKLDSKKLIRDTQHGFTQGRSCLTNLLKFFEEVTAYVDEGSPVDVLYLDFSKAFDKVPHKRLVNKVKAYGIGNNIWRWIEAWLSDRSQRVVINGHASGWATVTSGVPQGSVLGPTLFVIYVNGIDDGITSSLLKFADDTKLLRKVGTQYDCEALQKDLHTMNKL